MEGADSFQQVRSIASTNCDSPLHEVPDSSDKDRSVVVRGFSIENAPKQILDVEYAVRGEVFSRALEIEKNIEAYKDRFTEILPCHIGNPHIVGVKPLSYLRELVTLFTNKFLLEKPDQELIAMGFTEDGIKRARLYYDAFKEPGSYTHSQGALKLRQIITGFFLARDGFQPDPSNIFLSNGASDIIGTILTCCVRESTDAVLLPFPQYPLYSAIITKLGGRCIYYALDEDNEWSLNNSCLTAAYKSAQDQHLNVKAIVVISPGNPAPTLLDEPQIKEILKFASDKNIPCIADEVYQDNIYNDRKKFTSFRKVLKENDMDTQLASIHSCSKGFYGECGFRGGLALFDNVDKSMIQLLYKMRSVDLCSNTIGQAVLTAVLSPPVEGDASYSTYVKERDEILGELKEKALYTWRFFNSIDGIECQPINGALYAFPRVHFSKRAIEAAKERNHSVEVFYCLELVEATGIVTTPGDGFGKDELGRYHFRSTILPPKKQLIEALDKFRKFHIEFTARFSSD